MRHTDEQVLLRIFMEESYRHKGRPAYQVLLTYLRKHDYAGATVLRGIEGYGRSHQMHSADILELSSDLPIIIEIVASQAKAEQLKDALEASGMLGSALMTEETVKATRFK